MNGQKRFYGRNTKNINKLFHPDFAQYFVNFKFEDLNKYADNENPKFCYDCRTKEKSRTWYAENIKYYAFEAFNININKVERDDGKLFIEYNCSCGRQTRIRRFCQGRTGPPGTMPRFGTP